MVLRALAERHRISLLVVPLVLPYDTPVPAAIADLCHRTAVLSIGAVGSKPQASLLRSLAQRFGAARRPPVAGTVEETTSAFRDVSFDVVHVFRLYMLPYTRPYLGTLAGHRPQRYLDLDDIESMTRRRMADLYRLNGDTAMARMEEAAAQRCAALEADVLREFDRVYVCSERDKQELQGRSIAHVGVLPNAVPIPRPSGPKRVNTRFTFLFVGTLGYYPNEDAVQYFCRDVVPLIRQAASEDFRVTILGTGATRAIQELTHNPQVRVIGAVPDVAPWYRDADAVVAPIRAGGGTRIKVLEAFSYQRPVVSTSIGIEGIDARDGEHVLVGDTPDAFAERCVQLMSDPHLAVRLATSAYSLFLRSYTPEAVTRALAALPEPPPH
jgi:glycosyltransferase involved in cell wall biosynthesis